MSREPNPDYAKVLRQTLEALPHTQLVELLLGFATEDDDVRHALMRLVTGPSQVSPPQLDNPALVSQLKKQITRFFDNIDDNVPPDYEAEDIPEIDDFLDDIEALSPGDQLIMLPHLVEAVNSSLNDYGLTTSQLDDVIKLYGQVAATLDLTHAAKIPHFDLLFDWLGDLEIWDYGTDRTALLESLLALASTHEDYVYLIQQINRRLKAEPEARPELVEWLAALYLKAGDEANYLKVREDNLENEAQYYELADYWKSKSQPEKYLATLEAWLTFINKLRAEGASRTQYSSFGSYERSYSAVLGEHVKAGIILEKLVEHYRGHNDEENLLRVLMAQAEHRGATFELYQTIKPVAERLERWEEVLRRFMGYAQHHDDVLAQIYLYEQEWDAALEVARRKNRYGYSVIDLVAQGVKQHRPTEAIKLYEKLVTENINEGDRKHYHFAAEYAAKVKEIYVDILKDQPTWKGYVDQIRIENKRRRALQDEFSRL